MRLLEIGSHEGKGLAAFYFFLPNTKFLGANINPFQMKYTSKRITELYVDVSCKEMRDVIRFLSYLPVIKHLNLLSTSSISTSLINSIASS